jgi:hypothetical protein
MMRVSMDHIVTMFQEDRKHSGSTLNASLEIFWKKVNSVIHYNAHQAKGNKQKKLTIALTESCVLVLCARVIIAATHANVGLFTI